MMMFLKRHMYLFGSLRYMNELMVKEAECDHCLMHHRSSSIFFQNTVEIGDLRGSFDLSSL